MMVPYIILTIKHAEGLEAIKEAKLTKYLGVNSAVRLRSVYEFCEK